MDDSTLVTRKDAANRDKQYDLRTLVNHQISERICTPGFGLEYTWLGIISICHMSFSLLMKKSGGVSSPPLSTVRWLSLISSDEILLLQ
jgi:hypothetical protein